MTDWKKIYESTSTIKAQLAKAYLMDEHQIEAIVLNKQDSSLLWGLCEVHVPMKDAVLAKFLLENEGGIN
jgi:Putative prokaryotic signal transducing protein